MPLRKEMRLTRIPVRGPTRAATCLSSGTSTGSFSSSLSAGFAGATRTGNPGRDALRLEQFHDRAPAALCVRVLIARDSRRTGARPAHVRAGQTDIRPPPPRAFSLRSELQKGSPTSDLAEADVHRRPRGALSFP